MLASIKLLAVSASSLATTGYVAYFDQVNAALCATCCSLGVCCGLGLSCCG